MKEFLKFDDKFYCLHRRDELANMKKVFDTNWMTTIGENINEIEHLTCVKIDEKYSIALSEQVLRHCIWLLFHNIERQDIPLPDVSSNVPCSCG